MSSIRAAFQAAVALGSDEGVGVSARELDGALQEALRDDGQFTEDEKREFQADWSDLLAEYPYLMTPDGKERYAAIAQQYGIAWVYRSADEIVAEALRRNADTVRQEETPLPLSSFYRPNDAGAHPAIVLLHGSEGASGSAHRQKAITLAKHGFCALAFGYYEPPNLLAHVDLENTLAAARWLSETACAGGRRVGVWGASRGGEQTVLLVSLIENADLIAAAAAHAPHATVVGAYDPEHPGDPPRDPDGRLIPAWRFHGQDIPPGLPIAIEAYAGPVYLSHGELDRTWDVGQTRTLAARLEAAGRHPEVHIYPGEGHGLLGQPAADDLAQVEAFFRRYLPALPPG